MISRPARSVGSSGAFRFLAKGIMSKTPGTSFEFSQSPSLVDSVGIEPLWSHVYTELTPQNFPSTIARGDVPERLFLGPEIYGRGSEVAPSMTAEEIKSVRPVSVSQVLEKTKMQDKNPILS